MKRLIFLLAAGLLVSFPSFASIIKKPPVKQVDLSYHELVCTEQDQANIYEIISAMAEKSKLGLLFNQSHLRGLGDQITHVHPLKFLATIFKNPYLKSCMFYIWDDHFKRNGLLDGLAPALSREVEKGKLHMHLVDFAKDVGVHHDSLKPYFDSKNWEGLVLFLIQS